MTHTKPVDRSKWGRSQFETSEWALRTEKEPIHEKGNSQSHIGKSLTTWLSLANRFGVTGGFVDETLNYLLKVI
jgi:hypothetical protein